MPFRLIGVQQQLGLCGPYDHVVEGGSLLSDAGGRHAAQCVVHLGHSTLTQDEHGALHVQRVELQPSKERS